MAYFKRNRFSGIAPAISPRLLGDQFAQVAENIDFERGNIKPVKVNGSSDWDLSTNSRKRSIYYYETPFPQDYWLEWDEDYVKAVPGPIPGDTDYRLYWTGDGYPKYGTFTQITSSRPHPGAWYKLGVPAPDSAPTVTITGELDGDVDPVEEYAWVYTYVTKFGEEGPPSYASNPLLEFTPTTQVAEVVCKAYTGVDAGQMAFGGGKIRLYRSNTGSQLTFFQYVDEQPYAQTVTFRDDKLDAELGEVLPSDTWIGPPDGNTTLYPDGALQGLIPVANGVFAGHVGKRLCMSEAYLPHAWPIGNRITLERDIVAIGTTANGIVALTDGKPYFVTGVEPSAMTAITIDLAQACTNKFSVVDMGDYLLYAGPDGLCAVSGGEGRVVTKGLIDVEAWRRDYFPDTCKAFLWEGVYVACNPATDTAWVYDPRASDAALSWTDAVVRNAEDLYGGYSKLKDGELYLIDNWDIIPFQTGSGNKTTKWRSKRYVTEAHASMSWLSVAADWIDNTNAVVEVHLSVDGLHIFSATFTPRSTNVNGTQFTITTTVYNNLGLTQSTGTDSNAAEPTVRLPPYAGREFEIEVGSNIEIDEVSIASSMDEIRST